MSQYRIPNQGKLSQPNKGDTSGNVRSTLNVDIRTNQGRIRLSPRMTLITDSTTSSFGLPVGFATMVVSSTEEVIIATGSGAASATGTGKVFANAAVGFGAFSAVASSPSTVHHLYSDLVSWAGKETNTFKRIYVSTFGVSGGPDVAQFDGSSWDTVWYSSTRVGTTGGGDDANLVNAAPVHLCPGFNGNLYIGQEFQIMYAPYTGNIVKSTTKSGANTQNGTIYTGGKYVVTWVRSSSDRLWVGLMEASSATESHLGGYVGEWDGTGTAFNNIYKINAPCVLSCAIVNDVPYIIDGYGILKKFNGGGFSEVARLPVANQNVEMPGIYKLYTNNRWIHTRGMESDGGLILINVSNFVSTGVYVQDMPSGIWEFDTENPTQGLHHRNSPCVDTNDYGQQATESTGAVFPLRVTGGNYLAGVSYYTDDATTNRKGVFYDNAAANTNKKGSLVTPFLTSATAQDSFNTLSYRFRQLPSGDKIIGKYRTGKKANMPFIASITWTSTTTFTSTDANFAHASDGDEIEGVMGKGASSTAHISGTPTLVTTTYTVTLDEAIGFSSGTAKVKVDNFKKVGVISRTDNNQEEFQIPNATNAEAQIKTEMRFTGDIDLNDLTVLSETH